MTNPEIARVFERIALILDIKGGENPFRIRAWLLEVLDEIKRLRMDHPNLGKEKLHIFLERFGRRHALPIPSASTVGRLIAHELLHPDMFNAQLMGYLVWFNTERPHYALNLQSPLQFLLQWSSIQEKCNYGWTDTFSCMGLQGTVLIYSY